MKRTFLRSVPFLLVQTGNTGIVEDTLCCQINTKLCSENDKAAYVLMIQINRY